MDYFNRPNILFFACWNNQTEIIKECIQNGYEINQENIWFQTPLIIASRKNNLNAVKILVENAADLNIIDIYGSTALGYAKDQSDVQNYLISKGAKFKKNSIESMPNLIKEIDNQHPVSTSTTKEMINKIDSWGFSPFMWTIWHQQEDHFEHYLELGADVNQKCRNGITPLMLASFYFNLNMVEELIEEGALVNDTDYNGNSALIYSTSSTYNIEIADSLICDGADINNGGVNNRPTPLIVAVISSNLTALKYCLKPCKKANVNVIDGTGNTALAYASYFGRIDTAKILIENRADLDLCGPKGKTPLSWAATTNNLKMVEFLLRNGAKVSQKDYQNHTALSYAKQYGHSKIFNYLEQMKDQEINPLCFATQKNDLELVKSLIKTNEDPCKVDTAGNTPLMIATRAKNQKIVKYLLKNGADLTVDSALPVAIEENYVEILKILVEHGANVNKYCKRVKQTPLEQAVSLNNAKIVQFLVENGADPNLTGNLLRTAIQLKCYYNILKYLIENGTDVNETSENQPSLLKLAIEQKKFRLIILLVNHGANVKNDIRALEGLSKENKDFLEFFNKKIVSQIEPNKDHVYALK